MTKKVQIFFIYADNCEHCQKLLSLIEEAISESQENCQLLKFKYDTRTAIAIAINNNIDDLPGFVIGRKAFQGDDYSKNAIKEAIKNAARN